jgi:hypothetical protein
VQNDSAKRTRGDERNVLRSKGYQRMESYRVSVHSKPVTHYGSVWIFIRSMVGVGARGFPGFVVSLNTLDSYDCIACYNAFV